MTANIMNEDLRSIKTEKSLFTAMFTLLKSNSFRKITIKAICEEALISRATFYAHYVDKYDLLKHWMSELLPQDINKYAAYEQFEEEFNDRIYENKAVLKNLVYEADDETFGILFDFMLSTINLSCEKNDDEEIYLKNIVLSNFYAGGAISYLLWQVKNKFPSEVRPMNKFVYEMIKGFQCRQSKKGQ